jgi:hypothetical protein
MGIHKDAPSAPDTFGLEEYFVTDIATEVIGGNVRLVCGARIGEHVQWRYTVVLPAEHLMRIGRECQQAAEEAFLIQELMDRRKGH